MCSSWKHFLNVKSEKIVVARNPLTVSLVLCPHVQCLCCDRAAWGQKAWCPCLSAGTLLFHIPLVSLNLDAFSILYVSIFVRYLWLYVL